MNENSNIIIYQSENGKTHVEVKLEENTVWLTQQQMCDLYQTSKSNVSEHIKHIFEDGEGSIWWAYNQLNDSDKKLFF